jgi:hypothetical protein
MKKILLGVFALCLMGARVAQGQTVTVRLYIAPSSTIAIPDIMKNLVSKCPNTTITIDPLKSDFMLQARGGSGNYKFTVFQRGDTAIYGTTTVTLSNAVKDVCDFVKSPQAQLNMGPAPAPNSPPQAANVSADSLNIVNHALKNAVDDLLKAANQSDYVQKAIADIDQALDDAKQAAAHGNDDSAAAASTATPNFDAAPPPARLTNFMLYSSLNSLKSAYDALTRVPGGDFGGYRTRMNDDIAAAAEVLVNGIASYNAKQAASDSGASGDAVDGIQLHLVVAKNLPPYVAPSRPGDLPWLEMQILNKGTDPVTFSCHIGQMSEIEIDGVWHEPGGFFQTGACPSPPDLMPAHKSAAIFVAIQFLIVNGKSVPFDGFHVGPGKHVVRVRTPSKSFGVEDSAHTPITLVSNAIAIETPAVASAQSDGESWGEPVDGIQLGLAYSKNASALLPVYLPHLEVQIRNIGTDTVNYSCYLGQTTQIEIDGVWYEQGPFGITASCHPPSALVPGTRTGKIPLSLRFVNRQTVPFDKLNLTPGKHSIRVRASVGEFPVITLLSNSVIVEVPSPNR